MVVGGGEKADAECFQAIQDFGIGGMERNPVSRRRPGQWTAYGHFEIGKAHVRLREHLCESIESRPRLPSQVVADQRLPEYRDAQRSGSVRDPGETKERACRGGTRNHRSTRKFSTHRSQSRIRIKSIHSETAYASLRPGQGHVLSECRHIRYGMTVRATRVREGRRSAASGSGEQLGMSPSPNLNACDPHFDKYSGLVPQPVFASEGGHPIHVRASVTPRAAARSRRGR